MTQLENAPASNDNADDVRDAGNGGYVVQHYINGKRVASRSGRTVDIFNPAVGKPAGHLHMA